MATSRDREEANRRFDAEKDVAKNRKTYRRLADIARKAGIEMIDVRPVVCTPISRAGNAGTKEGDGDFFCPLFDRNGTLLYWDWHHWAFPSLGGIGKRLATRPEAHVLFRAEAEHLWG